MITSPYLFRHHKFTVISTIALCIATLPFLFFSSIGYIIFAVIILTRGSLLYSAVAYGIAENHEAYVTQVVASDTFRKALTNHILHYQA